MKSRPFGSVNKAYSVVVMQGVLWWHKGIGVMITPLHVMRDTEKILTRKCRTLTLFIHFGSIVELLAGWQYVTLSMQGVFGGVGAALALFTAFYCREWFILWLQELALQRGPLSTKGPIY